MIKKYFLNLILIILIFSCTNPEKFIKKEKSDIKINCETILNSLGYSDYTLLVIPHSSYGLPKENQEISLTSFKGNGFSPNGPVGCEGQVPPEYKELDTVAGSYKMYGIKNIYSKDDRRDKLHIDYFSLVVIIKGLNTSEAEKLEVILLRGVMNLNRGDQVIILSKS